jgi:hypothetical protein
MTNAIQVTTPTGQKMSYNAARAGWLLTSCAPKNVAKGEKLFATLSESDKADAQEYAVQTAARACVVIYENEGMGAASDEETRQAKLIAARSGADYWEIREELNDAIANLC